MTEDLQSACDAGLLPRGEGSVSGSANVQLKSPVMSLTEPTQVEANKSAIMHSVGNVTAGVLSQCPSLFLPPVPLSRLPPAGASPAIDLLGPNPASPPHFTHC